MVGLRLHEVEVAGVCPPLSLDIPAGEVRAAVVPDQRAVYALANVVVGLDEPDSGQVLVDGTEVRQQHDDHRSHRPHGGDGRESRPDNRPSYRHDDRPKKPHCRIRLVPASGGLVPERTVFDNILSAQCPTARMSRDDAGRMVRQSVSSLGLDRIVGHRPDHLTPVERRLAGLALALCWEPGAVVLEDAPGMPSWDVVITEHHRARHGATHPAAQSPADVATTTPEPFEDVACFLITTDASRAWLLDDDPVGVEPEDS
jgi:ABC-type polar amino acid transport system ATPase subunit